MTSLSHDIKKDLDILNDIDTSIATLYQGRLVTNAKYVDDILVCSHCGATTSHFKFKIHELLDSTEKEIYQCDQCNQYIFTHYPYTDKPCKTFL